MTPEQRDAVREAMQKVAESRPTGRSKLVYDKATRTIIVVDDEGKKLRVCGLRINHEDTEMFAY